jgi:DNA-binding XRE family transcriptional regulator
MPSETTALPMRYLTQWMRKLLLHPSVPSGTDEWHVVAELLGWDAELLAKRDGQDGLAAMRMRVGLTQEQLAEEMGVPRPRVRYLESGRASSPEALDEIATAVGILLRKLDTTPILLEITSVGPLEHAHPAEELEPDAGVPVVCPRPAPQVDGDTA